jgi:hypothetical protein
MRENERFYNPSRVLVRRTSQPKTAHSAMNPFFDSFERSRSEHTPSNIQIGVLETHYMCVIMRRKEKREEERFIYALIRARSTPGQTPSEDIRSMGKCL